MFLKHLYFSKKCDMKTTDYFGSFAKNETKYLFLKECA